MKQLNNQNLLKSQAYINGHWIDAGSNKSFEVTNPFDGSVIARVPDITAKQTEESIQAAHEAFRSWRTKTAEERAELLLRWHDLMMDNQDDLATIMTAEQGKPFREAQGEIAYAAGFIKWFAEEAKRVYGDIIPSDKPDNRILVLKQPVGVCAAITPWNFPSAMITRKAAAALAAGCTMVVKPAEDTPLSALALAELADQAGIPYGVLNIVTSSDSKTIGEVLTTHDLVRKVTFTGSTEVGRILMRQSADTIKKISLELGGNAPFIVFDDADLDSAIDGAVACKFRNGGQTCVCANRFLVQEGIYDRFVEGLTDRVKDLKTGDGFAQDTDIGPLINAQAVDKVVDHIEDALSKGASLMTGAKQGQKDTTFFEPTVLSDMTPDMKIMKEETFGPVAPVFRFQDEKEALRLANDTKYGLASYAFTKDIGRVWRVMEELEYGMVAINRGLLSTPVAPFGGVKQSGLGREGSKYGIEEYLDIKYGLLGL